MEVDWDRRRRNLRILLAVQGLKPTPLALSVGLSGSALTPFVNGKAERIGLSTLQAILEPLGLTSISDLDADSVIDNPRMAIRRLVDAVPDEHLEDLLSDLRDRFPDQAQE